MPSYVRLYSEGNLFLQKHCFIQLFVYICTPKVKNNMSKKQLDSIDKHQEIIDLKRLAIEAGIADNYQDVLELHFPKTYKDNKKNKTLLKNVWNLRSYDSDVIKHIKKSIKLETNGGK